LYEVKSSAIYTPEEIHNQQLCHVLSPLQLLPVYFEDQNYITITMHAVSLF